MGVRGSKLPFQEAELRDLSFTRKPQGDVEGTVVLQALAGHRLCPACMPPHLTPCFHFPAVRCLDVSAAGGFSTIVSYLLQHRLPATEF